MKNDMFAFERLVERNRDDLYSFALRMTRSEIEATEIAQESFLSAYLHLSNFRNEAEFRAWAHWIAAKHMSLRRRFLRTSAAVDGPLKAPESRAALAHNSKADENGSADEQALSAELRRAIAEATDRLPQSHRDAFLFKDVAGLSYEQIADVSGQSIPAIKDHLHQARLSLRATIDRFYREPDGSVRSSAYSAGVFKT
jgi:RNA polymerase sigma-70 factor (ECF subfamily)